LFPHGPWTDEAEAVNGPSGGAEGLEATDLGHRLFDPEMVAFDALLQVFGDMVDRVLAQQAVLLCRLDGGWKGPGPSVPMLSGESSGSGCRTVDNRVLLHFACLIGMAGAGPQI